MNHQHLVSVFALLFTSSLALACSSTLEGDGSGTGNGSKGGGASAGEIDRCKAACDKMKFFDCNSAEEQARCYSDCSDATPDQIDVFTGCAENSICDPECRTSIQPKADPKTGGGGASSSSCDDACDKAVECGFVPDGAKSQCISECASKGYQYQIDCVNNTECKDIQKKCGGAGGGNVDISVGEVEQDPVDACLEQCDDVKFFSCAPAAAFSECRDACSSATASKRDTFTHCSESSGPKCDDKADCLDEFLK